MINRRTSSTLAAVVALFLFALMCMAENPATRTLEGQVMKSSEQPLPGAVVYLKNSRTMTMRTYISDDKGNYRFTSLSPNIDYVVYAEYKGSKSDTKTLSSFDSRETARINLKVNTQ